MGLLLPPYRSGWFPEAYVKPLDELPVNPMNPLNPVTSMNPRSPVNELPSRYRWSEVGQGLQWVAGAVAPPTREGISELQS